MARTITAGMLTEIRATVIQPLLFAKLEFDSGDLRLFGGTGQLTFNSEVYTGGDLLSISNIEETQEVRATGLVMQMSGVPSTLISDALNEDYQERPVSIWFGALDNSLILIVDPILVFKGRMDVMTPDIGPDTSTLQMTAENRLISLERPSERRYTDAEQKLDYPADRGFEFVTILNDGREIEWKA